MKSADIAAPVVPMTPGRLAEGKPAEGKLAEGKPAEGGAAEGGAAKIVRLPERAGKTRPARRSREELAFLPAALEIVETPPSPIGRTIGLTLVALFCAALAWAWWGTIDIVASATGKIVPSGRIKVIQPFETGVVRSIRVQDGQAVKAGDVLIELDPTANAADRDRLRSDLLAERTSIARLRAALGGAEDPLADFAPPAHADPVLVGVQRQLLLSQVGEHRAKLASLDRQHAQKEAELATTVATIHKLETVIPVIQQRVDMRRVLVEKDLGSKIVYLETLQLLFEQQKELLVRKSSLVEDEAAVAALRETRRQAEAEYGRTLADELAKAEQKAAGLAQELIKAEQKTRLQQLTAPVDGIVQQLAIHTVGGVVTPAQALLVVVPSDSRLEIEALVTNRDIGFVQPGQQAEIKVDTFNFTRYGLLHGEVLSVSQDAIIRDRRQDRADDRKLGMQTDSSEPKGQELNYSARISLDATKMRIDDRMVTLSPGMAVTVEIKTGSRRILSYLLSPLLRYRHDALRER
ncbi:MAG: HlyD family type I secretion periplasmic adaptor subunit [Reyranella sp.]|uniref:HlyD family type I secretion periplasmic adaptor subunit n=1 Tax=Reyranella sp. TaxID=1929291 RepID=UPI003D0D41E2